MATVKCVAGVTWPYLPVMVRNGEQLADFIRYIMPSVKPDWKQDQIVPKCINTGLGVTNELIGFYHKEPRGSTEEDIVMLRVNGINTELFINREREIYLRCLFNNVNMGSTVYCEFENGLCYGYIPGKTLEREKLGDPLVLRNIAKSIAVIHTYQLPGELCNELTTIESFHTYLSMITEESTRLQSFKEVFVSKEALSNEISDMKNVISKFSSPVVLCHNDLQPGNIIVGKDGTSVSFIDFEYAGPNHSTCEIGDFFGEYAGLIPDYTLYPGEEEQKTFIRMYLEEYGRLKGTMNSKQVTDEQIHKFYIEVNQGAAVMDLMWVLWSIVQSALHNEQGSPPLSPATPSPSDNNSTNSFNYMEYGIARYKHYLELKEEFCSSK